MRAKRSLTIAAALLAGSIAAASAADMPVAPPPPPAYNWTGWYLGVGVAGVWGESRQTFDPFVILGILFLPGGTVGPEFEQAMITFHGGRLHQFGNFGWGSIVVGLDSSASIPLDDSFGTTVVAARRDQEPIPGKAEHAAGGEQRLDALSMSSMIPHEPPC
jgi:opacity protein-like surface antigen